ncbi:MAG: 30S ribosomal protein S1 [Phycisphaerales bacterium]
MTQDQTPSDEQREGTPPATPSTPTESGAGMTGDMARQAEDAMRAAMAAPEADAKPAAPAPSGGERRPAIRGPRVVQGGREHRTGRVVSVGPDDIFIEFGPKELGVAPRNQWPEEELPKVGDDLKVVIDRFDANQSLFLCARPGSVQKAEWELLEPGQVVEAMCTGTNKGGLEMEVAGHRAFMPASKIDIHHVSDMKPFVGEKLKCVVSKVDRAGRGNIVLSRRDILAEERKGQREALQQTLKEGEIREGVVRKIMEFGAFVDLGGADGLVHISDLSYDRVRKVEDVVKEGETVRVKVLKLDWEKDRISLGMKQAQEDPFKSAASEVTAGETVSGKVTKILEFGALVEVAPGVEGLVHISELAWKRVARVEHVVKPDEIVQVKVLDVDTDKRRISLSIKQTQEAPKDARGRDAGRSAEEIQKETPALRRMREQAKQREKKGAGGLGEHGSLGGLGLGDLGKFVKD